jgi:hypothetical protein
MFEIILLIIISLPKRKWIFKARKKAVLKYDKRSWNPQLHSDKTQFIRSLRIGPLSCPSWPLKPLAIHVDTRERVLGFLLSQWLKLKMFNLMLFNAYCVQITFLGSIYKTTTLHSLVCFLWGTGFSVNQKRSRFLFLNQYCFYDVIVKMFSLYSYKIWLFMVTKDSANCDYILVDLNEYKCAMME